MEKIVIRNEPDLMKKMDIGQIFEWSFILFKKHFIYLMKVFSFLFIPFTLVIIFLGYFIYTDLLEFLSLTFQSSVSSTTDETAVGLSMLKLYGKFFLAILIYTCIAFIFVISTIRTIHIKLQGLDDTPGQVILFTLKKIPASILSGAVAVFMLAMGLSACGVPFFILFIYLIFLAHAIVIDNEVFSIGRTFSMVTRSFWPLTALVLIFYILFTIASSVISIPVLLGPYIKMIKELIDSGGQTSPQVMAEIGEELGFFAIIATCITYIFSIFLVAIFNIALTLKYLNIKNLKEGAGLLEKIDTQLYNYAHPQYNQAGPGNFPENNDGLEMNQNIDNYDDDKYL